MTRHEILFAILSITTAAVGTVFIWMLVRTLYLFAVLTSR